MCLFTEQFLPTPYLSTFLHTVMNFFQEISLSASLGVAYRRGIGRFCDKQVRPTFINPSRTQMSVRSHVIIPLLSDFNWYMYICIEYKHHIYMWKYCLRGDNSLIFWFLSLHQFILTVSSITKINHNKYNFIFRLYIDSITENLCIHVA